MPTSREERAADNLRRRAETELSRAIKQSSGVEADAKKLLHELQVHKIELELQNDELISATTQINFLLTEFSDLYDFAPIGYFTIGRNGVIKRANLTGASLFGAERASLVDQAFRNLIGKESRRTFAALLLRLDTMADGDSDSCEVAITRAGHSPTFVQINAVVTEARQTYRMVAIDISECKKLESERITQSQRIRELSHKLVALQEMERHALGTELHDRTSGNLAALDLLLNDLCERMPEPVASLLTPQIEDIQALLLETCRDIRDLSADIRPALLDHGGLIPALRDHACRFSKRTGIDVEVRSEIARRLCPDLESALFRITQEALTNCAKHAHAHSVKIVLNGTGNKVVLSIVDDGHGFLLESLFGPGAEPGLGIVSMEERAEFFGGKFNLKSTPGKGTKVTVEFERTPTNPIFARPDIERDSP